ncbi:MAG: M14 family metallopeptidase, partial [Patescibacteria group bacterium]
SEKKTRLDEVRERFERIDIKPELLDLRRFYNKTPESLLKKLQQYDLNMSIKKILIGLAVFILVGAGIYYYLNREEVPTVVVEVEEPEYVSEDNYSPESFEVIGRSVENRSIRAFKFGTGNKKLVFVGAIHGGYEWNTALLSYELIDYLADNIEIIPSDIEVTVIPVANPDGLYKAVGTSGRFFAGDAPQFDYANETTLNDLLARGRFNANDVDLNRNFDCKWQSDAVWRNYDVSGGAKVFSEPEALALRDFFLREAPEAVVLFHSASNGVYTSFCEGDALPGTEDSLTVYSEASGYARYDNYSYYEVTGDIGDWLSTINTPAITVELSSHRAIDWEKNRTGIEAMFEFYSDN